MATRFVETAKGTYKLIPSGSNTLAVNIADSKDVFKFRRQPTALTDSAVRKTIEKTIKFEDFDAEFLHDDFSWVHDFEQW